ncbi:taste receptor type 2 member 20-like [Trichechus manatus latirostris]|uniref:Taste receptor type 2 n=1 Tax=Trichechus manatus latirostris TaxID=127582 RepID=A0A2Y9RUS7_TRIMA|nr:taste receptor type 2 member 20-like [Trichechus manatus latirostris]
MISLLQSLITTLLTLAFVLGNLANGFIALTNCIDWVKRQKISSVDTILMALAVSRIGLLWVIAINWYLVLFNSFSYRLEARAIDIAWTVSNHFSTWLATCLSIFYLLKIANFSNLVFLHLKWRVERLVLVIMLGTLVILGFQLAVTSREENIWKNEYEGNMTLKTKSHDMEHFSSLAVSTLAFCLPFTMSLTSLLLLIFSLRKHLKKMQLNGRRPQDPRIKIHVKTMQTMISFLLLLAIYFLSLIIASWCSTMLQKRWTFTLYHACGLIYPSSHSFILILVNQKLRQAFLSGLWQLRCSRKERKPSTP